MFWGKTNDKIFQKIPKTLFWGLFGLFFPNLGKNEFSWKKWKFLNIPIIYHHGKNQKKLMSHSLEKCIDDRRADGQMDRQTGNSDFIEPSTGLGSKRIYWYEKRFLKNTKSEFEKDFYKLMNNLAFRKFLETIRKHIGIRLLTTKKRSNYLVSEPNYHTTK